MIFELGKKGFKSETICCEWENVEQSPIPNCHKKGYWCYFFQQQHLLFKYGGF